MLCVAVHPTACTLWSAFAARRVRLYHVDRTLVHTSRGTRRVRAVAVTPDGQHIISGGWISSSWFGAPPPRASEHLRGHTAT